MEGKTDIICPECGHPIEWVRIGFYTDGDYDWRLDIFCQCGDVKDPALLKQVRQAYGAHIGKKIAAAQEAALIQRIGEPLNDQLNKVVKI